MLKLRIVVSWLLNDEKKKINVSMKIQIRRNVGRKGLKIQAGM